MDEVTFKINCYYFVLNSDLSANDLISENNDWIPLIFFYILAPVKFNYKNSETQTANLTFHTNVFLTRHSMFRIERPPHPTPTE